MGSKIGTAIGVEIANEIGRISDILIRNDTISNIGRAG